MPAFAAAYGTGDWGCGRRAAADDIVMMLPDFRSFMPGRKHLMVRNVATVDYDLCPFTCERHRDGRANATGAAGHESDLPCQRGHRLR